MSSCIDSLVKIFLSGAKTLTFENRASSKKAISFLLKKFLKSKKRGRKGNTEGNNSQLLSRVDWLQKKLYSETVQAYFPIVADLIALLFENKFLQADLADRLKMVKQVLREKHPSINLGLNSATDIGK